MIPLPLSAFSALTRRTSLGIAIFRLWWQNWEAYYEGNVKKKYVKSNYVKCFSRAEVWAGGAIKNRSDQEIMCYGSLCVCWKLVIKRSGDWALVPPQHKTERRKSSLSNLFLFPVYLHSGIRHCVRFPVYYYDFIRVRARRLWVPNMRFRLFIALISPRSQKKKEMLAGVRELRFNFCSAIVLQTGAIVFVVSNEKLCRRDLLQRRNSH